MGRDGYRESARSLILTDEGQTAEQVREQLLGCSSYPGARRVFGTGHWHFSDGEYPIEIEPLGGVNHGGTASIAFYHRFRETPVRLWYLTYIDRIVSGWWV